MKFSIFKIAPLTIALMALLMAAAVPAHGNETFTVAKQGHVVPLVVAEQDALGVARAVSDFQTDIGRVTGHTPDILHTLPSGGTAILIGTLGHSELIDQLASSGKIDAKRIRGKWEAFLHQVVDNPYPGVERALVIAGSDRRGTMYGLYTLSEEFGVSPWYWWADVPVRRRDTLGVPDEVRVEAPAVQYRGIFLNDEAPALAGWADEKFGDLNSKMYARVFELLLRLRANFLWPAMWDNAFHVDDPMSPELAHAYGIVMGTSHHEPMMRAHKEWRLFGEGPWNYSTNKDVLQDFWKNAIEERKDYESIITLAMRGDGDEAMSEDTNVGLLERIVKDQRKILKDAFNKPLEEVPQVWALYKEVQFYYENGMRVPDDVILLWCDDNWGNIRRLPTPEERERSGGAGVYYHFDYVGGPRSYKWLDVQPLAKIWEQMHLAWKHEANRIWIVNVGDLKPMEFPIDFFLTMAWDPEAMPYERIGEFGREWAAQAFGEELAEEVASLLDGYTKLNRQRTPEMLEPTSYSLINYREAERISRQWKDLVDRADSVRRRVAPEAQDAYFQLVYYPVKASAVVRWLNVAAGLNRLYAVQGRTDTNSEAARVRELFQMDQELAAEYHSINDGKWNHMMSQINLGYTYWQQPPIEVMPAVYEVRPNPGPVPALAIESQVAGWPAWGLPEPKLPPLDTVAKGTRWVDLFNRGDEPFRFTASPDVPWLTLSQQSGTVEGTIRIEIGVDWERAPRGTHTGKVALEGGGQRFEVLVPVFNPQVPELHGIYIETDRHIAMEAPRYNRAMSGDGLDWLYLSNHGRSLGGVTLLPVTTPPLQPNRNGGYPASLEYDFYSFSSGDAELTFHLAPSLDIQSGDGLRFAYAIDDGPVTILPVGTWATHPDWQQAVANGVREVKTSIQVPAPGRHTLKVYAVTPAVVFQRLIIDFGGMRPSYLGPPESPRIP